ncbi:hypothetical protein [Nocardia sp. NPDC057030]|uniref:hypothetical protein n=1 Tax=unclassified Nocardia TaxID=2637762 RepID=UPI003630F0FE
MGALLPTARARLASLVQARTLVSAILAVTAGLLLTNPIAVAADPPRLCTAEQERAAEGNEDAARACNEARAASAAARYRAVPLNAELKAEWVRPNAPKSDVGVSPQKKKSLFGSLGVYAEPASDAFKATCLFAAKKEKGELCVDHKKCMASSNGSAGYCDTVAGGRPDDGVERDDSSLPEKLQDVKRTAVEAADAASVLGGHDDTAENRIALDEVEEAATAAVQAIGWLN